MVHFALPRVYAEIFKKEGNVKKTFLILGVISWETLSGKCYGESLGGKRIAHLCLRYCTVPIPLLSVCVIYQLTVICLFTKG